MQQCKQDGCRGHSGKFSSCLAEALYAQSLDGVDDGQTGDVEAFGHVTLYVFDAEETLDLEGLTVTVPAGGYLLTEGSQGTVTLTGDTIEGARTAFYAEERAFSQWLDETQPV